jgi:hypothetical protein
MIAATQLLSEIVNSLRNVIAPAVDQPYPVVLDMAARALGFERGGFFILPQTALSTAAPSLVEK